MPDEKSNDSQAKPKPESSSEQKTERPARRDRQFWTADADNPLIYRGID